MKRLLLAILAGLGLAGLSLALGAAPAVAADTCNPVYGTKVDCSGPASPSGNAPQAAPPAPTVKPVGPSLRGQLRQKPLTAAERQALADRINSDARRMNDIAAQASGTADPAAQAKLREQYEAAAGDLRRGVGDLEAATSDPAARAQAENFYKSTIEAANGRLVAAGLYSPALAETAPPTRQNGHSLKEILRRDLAADDGGAATQLARVQCRDDKGAGVKDCYVTLQGGGRCLKQSIGTNGWDYAELPTDQCPAEVKQAFCQEYPQDGLCPQAKPVEKAATAAPQNPAAPGNVAQIGDNTYVCDGPIAGANNLSCREISADGTQCTAVMLADGVVGWHDSISTGCGAADLAQRNAFLASKPHAAAFATDAPFAMDPGETRREIDKLTPPSQTPEEALFAQLPAQCADTFKKYLDDVGSSHTNTAEGQVHAADAIDSYQALDASQECRDAIKRIADANALELPVRHLNPRTRNAFGVAMAADPASLMPRQPAADAVALQDDGYDPQEVLAFGFALLSLATSAADLANAMHGGGAIAPGMVGAVRGFAGGSGGGGTNCFLQNANNIKACVHGPQSDIRMK